MRPRALDAWVIVRVATQGMDNHEVQALPDMQKPCRPSLLDHSMDRSLPTGIETGQLRLSPDGARTSTGSTLRSHISPWRLAERYVNHLRPCDSTAKNQALEPTSVETEQRFNAYALDLSLEEADMKFIQLLTGKQVSKMLGVPEGTLRYWRNVGLGPVWHKLEGSIRYDLADVEAYVQSSRRVPSVRTFMEQRHGLA